VSYNLRQESVSHRIRILEQLLLAPDPKILDYSIASKLLQNLQDKQKKLADGKHFFPECTTTKHSKNLTLEEHFKNLGSIYLLFGPSFEESFSFHTYRIEFLSVKPAQEYYSPLTVISDIYEDDELLLSGAYIDFWKNLLSDQKVSDVGISFWDHSSRKKYRNHFHWFDKLACSLAMVWNSYH